jgi:hypothetical protein
VIRRAAPLFLCAACSTVSSNPQFNTAPSPPLDLTVSSVPAPAADGTLARDAQLILQLDDFPDPDVVAQYGPVALRSGKLNFDFTLRVDLAGQALIVTPSRPFEPGTTYELSVDASLAALDGRSLGTTVTVVIPAGATLAGAPALAPAPTWNDLRQPLADRCATAGCHSHDAHAYALDLSADASPEDPLLGLIRVASRGLTDAPQPLDRVAPGDSSRSVLLRKLLGSTNLRVAGDRMPVDAPLPPDLIAEVQAWIDRGAQ